MEGIPNKDIFIAGIIKGHNPTLRPVSCDPDQKVVFIIPYQLFYVDHNEDGLQKFVPSREVLLWLQHTYNIEKIRIHSFIKRQIKQIGSVPQTILIPRIIFYSKGCKKTHNLIPDYVLPFCNYTVKSISIVFPHSIPHKTVNKLSRSEWDKCTDIACSKKNKSKVNYIKRRKANLFYRFSTITRLIFRPRRVIERKLSCAWGKCLKYYFCDSASVCIRPLAYLEHTIYKLPFT